MYGIRVPLAVDDYIWVTTDSPNNRMFEHKPLLFSTEEEAYKAAKVFGPLASVKKYEETEAFC